MNTATKGFNTASELKTTQEVGLKNTSKDLKNTLNKDVLYNKDPLNNDDILDIEESMLNLNIKDKLKKKAKTFIRIVQEIAQNTFAYSLKSKPTLSIEENKQDKYLSIKTSNYFDGGAENKEKLEKAFDKINNSSQEEVKNAYMEKLNDGEFTEGKAFGGAGLGLLDIARKIKKIVTGKIFDYKIKEEKDENNHKVYKLDLETKFPMPDMGMAA